MKKDYFVLSDEGLPKHQFLRIAEASKKSRFDISSEDDSYIDEEHFATPRTFSVSEYRRLYDEDFDNLIHLLTFDQNFYLTEKQFTVVLQILVSLSVFTPRQWDKIRPHLHVLDFVQDLAQLDARVVPLFKKIWKYRDCFFLEFWQGYFSFGTHWGNPASNPDSPQNGDKYLETLKKIRPYFKTFLEYYPESLPTLAKRYSFE